MLDICNNLLYFATKGHKMLQSFQAVRLPSKFVSDIKKESETSMRSIPKQIEYLVMLGRAVRDNPDLPADFIQGVLEGKREIDAGLALPFQFRTE